jgi:hypothetical protein
MTTQQKRRGRRWLWLVAVLVVLALVVALGGPRVKAAYFPDIYDAPESVELPPRPDQISPTLEFLAGPEGTLVQRALDATRPLTGEPVTQTCTEVAHSIQAVGEVDAVFSAATAIPDPPTSEMAVHHFDAALRFLGHCLEDNTVPDNAEIRFTATVLDRRLGQLR